MFRRAVALLVTLGLALPLPACGIHDIYVACEHSDRGLEGKDTHMSFLWGWVGPDLVVDGNTVTWVQTDIGIDDLLLRLITVGIVWPSRVKFGYAQDVRGDPPEGGPDPDDDRFLPADRRTR